MRAKEVFIGLQLMAAKRVGIQDFIALIQSHPVFDVRSPAEYSHAHIPGAHSLPLFSDEERRIVGTAYKQESRQKAIKLGLNFFGPKMSKMVEDVEKHCHNYYQEQEQRTILVHCWRGGMRSGAVAWLLDLYGFNVITLAGGYKAFRNWVLKQFEKEYECVVVGGLTGSGKTYILNELKQKGELVVDLEQIASHRGSAFGNLGMPPQPTQEMFENKLALALSRLTHDVAALAPIWIEDESQRIGNVNTPTILFKQLRTKPVFFIELSFEHRLDNIIKDYGSFKKEVLEEAIHRISKRLGGLETRNALEHLHNNDISSCFKILLGYYDKLYLKSLQLRENWKELLTTVPSNENNPTLIADKLIQQSRLTKQYGSQFN